MKTLLIINGPPGVGKTTICRQLNKEMEHSIWLDGDWCWMINPFEVTEENKRMVEDNITHLLRSFLSNSSIETVIFSWVIPRDSIYALLLKKLKDFEFKLVKITLVCSEQSLQERMLAAGRNQDQVSRSAASMAKYWLMETRKLDTTDMDISKTVDIIRALICVK